jgi:hypothetical protein
MNNLGYIMLRVGALEDKFVESNSLFEFLYDK